MSTGSQGEPCHPTGGIGLVWAGRFSSPTDEHYRILSPAVCFENGEPRLCRTDSVRAFATGRGMHRRTPCRHGRNVVSRSPKKVRSRAMPARTCSSPAEADGGLHRLPQGETRASAPAPPVTDSRGSDRHARLATVPSERAPPVDLNASGTPWTSRVSHISLDNFANQRSRQPGGHLQLPIVERMKQETWTFETQT